MFRGLLGCSLVLALISVAILPRSAAAAEGSDSLFQDALARYQRADYNAALIQLKNVLRDDPDHLEARLLEGEIHLKLGDAAAAEDVFTEALHQGAKTYPTTLRLAEAYLRQSKFQSIIDLEMQSHPPGREDAELLGYQAIAYFADQLKEPAETAITNAQAAHPRALMPNLARGQILLVEGQYDDAFSHASDLVELYPESARAWQLRALALKGQGNLESALTDISRAITLDAHLVTARVNRATILISLGRDQESHEDLDFLAANYPMNLKAEYLRAGIFERAGELEAADIAFRHCTYILSKIDGFLIASSMELTLQAATCHQRIGEYESARAYLEAYNIVDPDSEQVATVLASVLLQLKKPREAIEVIEPALNENPDDQQLKQLMVHAYKLSGQTRKALQLQQEIALAGAGSREVTPDLQIALRDIGSGDFRAGVSKIKQAVDEGRLPEEESFALASAYLNGGRYAEATVLAAGLVKTAPDNTAYLNLLGTILMRLGRLEDSYATLLKADSIDANRLPTQLNLARVEFALDEKKSARDRLVRLWQLYPKDPSVLSLMAKIEYADNNIESAGTLAKGAVTLSPDWVEPRILLTRLYLEAGAKEEAVDLAKKTVALDENNTEARFLLAAVQEANGQMEQALVTYKVIQRRSTFDAEQLRRAAKEQMRLGAWADASVSLWRALQLESEHTDTRKDYLSTLLVLNSSTVAVEQGELLVAQQPDDAEAHALYAEALGKAGRPADASRAYLRALALAPTTTIYVVGAAKNMALAGNVDEAENLLLDKLNLAPDATLLVLAYVQLLMEQQRWEDASTALQMALQRRPDHPMLLNNLAYTLHVKGANGALEYARKAYQSAPDSPYVNDTLGWILVSAGDPQEGVVYLERAARALQDNAEVRYHLGYAYSKLGRAADSATELREALALSDAFEGRETAQRLLDSVAD
jgi:putative PEP-CTERM system TPR-repeat lipoprotein